VSVYFRDAGLSREQVGYAWGIWCAALTLSPALVTMLADARIDPRLLLAFVTAGASACLLALAKVHGVGPLLVVWTGYCLTSMPVLPLLDGIYFSQQRLRAARGEPVRSYPHVRVWGTIGYMVPSVLLFGLLQRGLALADVLEVGAAFGVVAALQAIRIDDPRSPEGVASDAHRRLPTLAAARTMLKPPLLVFVAALLLLQIAGSSHSGFYPIYLTERVGLADKWIGQASNLAVFVEMFFVFGCTALVVRFGVKRLLLIAMAATALRLSLLAVTSNPWVAVGSQVVHGLLVVATGVIPPMVLNDAAEDRFRHSMQGLYVMIGGAGRAAANVAAGPIAAWSLSGLFGIAAGFSVLAGLLILVAFREPRHEEAACEKEAAAPVEGMPTEAT
jgi:PPP family 3-phenylpropionic acid transporter